MNKQIKISNHSCYDNYTIKDNGTNHSSIVTKMVQLAGRICERFASDIVYDADAFIEAINNNKDFDRYLFFRENGVTAFKPEDVECIEGTDYIQSWHLTYNAETQEQEFTRTEINLERKGNMKIRYYVSGIGYDKNDCVTDYDREFGDFDTVEEAQEKFDEAVREAEDNLDEFFLDSEPEVTYWHIQLEKCEETKSEINCIDVIDEIDICKEEI